MQLLGEEALPNKRLKLMGLAPDIGVEPLRGTTRAARSLSAIR